MLFATTGFELLLTWIIGISTISGIWLSGYPFLCFLKLGGKGLSRHILGLITGICILSLTGALAEFAGIGPIYLQLVILATGLFLAVYIGIKKTEKNTIPTLILIIPISIYCLFLWSFFYLIGSWMGGDSVAHASIIRLLIDNHPIPISLPPFGTYWEYYPKGFHLLAYPFASLFGILPIIQTLPVVLTALIPLTLYGILIECNQREAAWYSLLLGLFCVPQIYVGLIWGGYPSITASAIMTAAVLAYMVDKRLIPLFGAGILIIHSREFALFLAVLAGLYGMQWLSMRKRRLHQIGVITSVTLAGIIFIILSIPTLIQVFLPGLTNPSGLALQAIRWYWIIPALCGIGISVILKEEGGRELIGWICGLVFFLLVVLVFGQMDPFPPERILTDCAVPLCAMGGLAFAAMERGAESITVKHYLSSVLIITGLVTMIAIFGLYTITWALPQDDHKALTWLSDQKIDKGLVINLDETGAWAYALTGITVSHPRVIPSIEPVNVVYTQPWSIEQVLDQSLIRNMTRDYHPVFLYKSSVSVTHPGYVPPFAEYPVPYPDGRINLTSPSYLLLYDKGAQIYEFQG